VHTIPKLWKQPHWRILCLHGIEKDQTEGFRRQMAALLDAGLQPVSFERGFQAICSDGLSCPMFTVTFDDADTSVFENALQVLESFGIRAFFYIAPDYIQKGTCYRDTPGRPALSWERLREWRDRGHGVGSHTLTHANLKRRAPEVCLQELRDSKALLEDQLQQPIDHFSYPWGQHSPGTYAAIKSSGLYASAATIDRGQMRLGHDPFLLRRDVCGPATSVGEMLKRMRLADNPVYRCLTRVRRLFLKAGG